MNRKTETLALLSGLAKNWQAGFSSDVSIDIRSTDPNNSDKSVSDTIGMMGVHANNATASPQIANALTQARINEKDSEDSIISKVFSFIKRKVKFVEDESQLSYLFSIPNSKELLITPPVLLTMNNPRGDCDDFSMLACSMLMACGIKCDFKTIAADENLPEQFTHVYCQVTTSDGRKIPFDASHGKEVGWETNKRFREMVWPIINWKGLSGMPKFTSGPIGPAKSHVHALNGLGRAIAQGLGDYFDDEGNYIQSGGTDIPWSGGLTVSPYPVSPAITQASSPSFSTVLNNLLPGIFGSAEKIAIQTTQQPGYQTTGPGGQTMSYVLPQGSSSMPAIPGISSGSSSMILWIALGLGGVLLLSKFAKG